MKLLTSHWVKDIDEKTNYLLRWSLWLPGGWSLKLHKIVRADKDRCEHDHPWWFVRLILYGGYQESVNGKLVARRPGRVYFCRPSFRHSIRKLFKEANWSLVLCGPNKGYWGFYTKAGWVPWQSFLETVKKAVAWCDR